MRSLRWKLVIFCFCTIFPDFNNLNSFRRGIELKSPCEFEFGKSKTVRDIASMTYTLWLSKFTSEWPIISIQFCILSFFPRFIFSQKEFFHTPWLRGVHTYEQFFSIRMRYVNEKKKSLLYKIAFSFFLVFHTRI